MSVANLPRMSSACNSGRFPGSTEIRLEVEGSKGNADNLPTGCGDPNAMPGTDQVSFGTNWGSPGGFALWVAVENNPEAHNNRDNNTNNIELTRRESGESRARTLRPQQVKASSSF